MNNYTPRGESKVQELVDNEEFIVYVTYGREVGQEGTPHLQGYVELSERKTLATMRRLLVGAHLEKRKRSQEQAIEYCQKDGDFEEYGDRSEERPGKRNDLVELKESLDRGSSLKDISDEHFASFLRYERSIRSFLQLHAPKTRDAPSVVVYHGTTGTGKTRAVWENAPSPDDVWVYGGKGWFDGYYGQPIALFDDFNGGEMQLTLLLKVLDRYPLQVPVKGSFVPWTPSEIYITSNIPPNEWFPNARGAHRDALIRRFTNVVNFQ